MGPALITKALDHYFDQGDYLREDRLRGVAFTPVFVDRGDPTGWDLDHTGMVADSAWHDWDLSAIVPDGAVAVLLGVHIANTSATQSLMFRKNGNVNNFNIAEARTQVATVYNDTDVIVACDQNRVIEYWLALGGTWLVYLTVRGWWK